MTDAERTVDGHFPDAQTPPLTHESRSPSLAGHAVLRALREARGITKEAWADRLGYSVRTVHRWETGTTVPDARAEAALIALFQETGAFRPYDRGPLTGHSPTPAWLRQLLTDARLGVDPEGSHHAPDRTAPDNLPVQLTRFIGRELDLERVRPLLANARLLTITGTGGIGKTRLALQVAATLATRFAGGVYFADLAPLQDPLLVPSVLAEALGILTYSDASARESVLRFVRDKRLLLVLDNYEHLLPAAEFAGALLQEGPGVSLLVTSRAPLRVPGEREYALAPLPVPDATPIPVTAAAANPAIALFVERAQSVRADFTLNAENVSAVTAICRHLDGLPLAIELAAARVRSLPPAALLVRLTQRLVVLTGGARTVPARHQTLRGAVAWSYDLLAPAAQRLFRRLGVFAGGCSLDLAESVCNAGGELGLDVLDGVSALVETSLLRETGEWAAEPRYRMLETIREFALNELEASGEAEPIRRDLAAQMLQLTRACAAANDWARLDAELDNVRVVLGWCVERHELDLGGRLFWALRWYLFNCGHMREQQLWRARLLALPEAAQPTVSRARLLAFVPRDLLSKGDTLRATAELEEAIQLSRALGDKPCLAHTLQRLALLHLDEGNYDATVPAAQEALDLTLEAGNLELAVTLRVLLITAAVERGDLATAEQVVAANRTPEDTKGHAMALGGEAILAMARGEYGRARAFFAESARRHGLDEGEQGPLRRMRLANLGQVMLLQGDTAAAVAACGEALELHGRLGPTLFLSHDLHVLAGAAERRGYLSESATLLAAVDQRRREISVQSFGFPAEHAATVARMRTALGDAAFNAAWAVGERLSTTAAVEFGLAVASRLQRSAGPDTVSAQPV